MKNKIANIFVGLFTAGLVTSVVLSVTCRDSYYGAITLGVSISCLFVSHSLKSCQGKKK